MRAPSLIFLLSFISTAVLAKPDGGANSAHTASFDAAAPKTATATDVPAHAQQDANQPTLKPGETVTMTLDQDAREALESVFNHEDANNFCYHLSAIVLYEKKWTVWLNQKPYTPGMTIPDIVILAVEPNRIKIQSNSRKGKPTQWVALDQTYCADTNVLSADAKAAEGAE